MSVVQVLQLCPPTLFISGFPCKFYNHLHTRTSDLPPGIFMEISPGFWPKFGDRRRSGSRGAVDQHQGQPRV